MKRTKELKTNKGITLIALVITIIVMLILVGVTLSMAINGGLFEQAGKAASKTNEALKEEEELSKGKIQIGDEVYNSIEEYVNKFKGDNVEKISKTKSYVGCYADVNGDKIADGVIYADLAFSREGNTLYGYSYEAVQATELKDYYVSGTHNGSFGNGKEVLTATGEGTDRFYVMALSDVGYYTWYESKAEQGVELVTSYSFGTGKDNTDNMLEMWNADTDENKSNADVWAHISNGWFLPSIAEWDAFTEALNITFEPDDEGIYSNEQGLSYMYWSSSLEDMGYSVYPVVLYDDGVNSGISGSNSVRLSATF